MIVQTVEEISYVLALTRVARLLVGQDEPDAPMSESDRITIADSDRITIADLIVSGWHPFAAAEYVRLKFPSI